MRKHEIAGAVARAGGAVALARLLGVRPETVRRWVTRGITPGGKRLLAGLDERRKLQAAEERTKRQTFALLFKLAGERGDLRKGRSREGTRAGPRTSGYQWVSAVGKMLTAELIAEIDAWLLSKRRRFPYWQASALATEYTKQKFKGYKVVMRQVADVEASGDFAVEEVIATSRSTKLSDVRGQLASKLEDAMEEGALVYIHEVTLFNYRLRTDEERLAWEAGKRSSRKRRAKRRLTPEQKAKRAAKAAERKEKKTWTKKTKSKTTSQTSSRESKKSTRETSPKAKGPRKKTNATVASRARNVSTRSQTTLSSSKRAKGKASTPTTFNSRSTPTTSKKSSTKPRSFSRPSAKTRTSKTQAKKAKTKRAKTRGSK